MMKMKNYYVLVALVCSAFSCAMERELAPTTEQSVENICYEIDKNILKIDPNAWNKRVVGSYVAYCKRREFADNPQEAIKLLCEVEKYIPQEHRNDTIFQKLQPHWLVYYLLYELIQYKVRQLNAVTGSTIDDVLNVDKLIPGLSPQMSKFINQSAHSSYAQSRLLDRPLEDIWFDDEENEIHYEHLNAWGAGEVCTLVIPAEGKCVKGVTSSGKNIVWYIEDGNEKNEYVPFSSADSQCFTGGYIVKDDYLVVLGNAGLSGTHSMISSILQRNKLSSAKRMFKESEIFLFKRPTLASRLCQKALWNCSHNYDRTGLMLLKSSQAAQGLKGFVQNNLFKKIDIILPVLEGCK